MIGAFHTIIVVLGLIGGALALILIACTVLVIARVCCLAKGVVIDITSRRRRALCCCCRATRNLAASASEGKVPRGRFSLFEESDSDAGDGDNDRAMLSKLRDRRGVATASVVGLDGIAVKQGAVYCIYYVAGDAQPLTAAPDEDDGEALSLPPIAQRRLDIPVTVDADGPLGVELRTLLVRSKGQIVVEVARVVSGHPLSDLGVREGDWLTSVGTEPLDLMGFFDGDGDGGINVHELAAALRKIKVLGNVRLEEVEVDSDDAVTPAAASAAPPGALWDDVEAEARAMMAKFDADGNGTLDLEELVDLLNASMLKSVVAMLCNEGRPLALTFSRPWSFRSTPKSIVASAARWGEVKHFQWNVADIGSAVLHVEVWHVGGGGGSGGSDGDEFLGCASHSLSDERFRRRRGARRSGGGSSKSDGSCSTAAIALPLVSRADRVGAERIAPVGTIALSITMSPLSATKATTTRAPAGRDPDLQRRRRPSYELEDRLRILLDDEHIGALRVTSTMSLSEARRAMMHRAQQSSSARDPSAVLLPVEAALESAVRSGAFCFAHALSGHVFEGRDAEAHTLAYWFLPAVAIELTSAPPQHLAGMRRPSAFQTLECFSQWDDAEPEPERRRRAGLAAFADGVPGEKETAAAAKLRARQKLTGTGKRRSRKKPAHKVKAARAMRAVQRKLRVKRIGRRRGDGAATPTTPRRDDGADAHGGLVAQWRCSGMLHRKAYWGKLPVWSDRVRKRTWRDGYFAIAQAPSGWQLLEFTSAAQGEAYLGLEASASSSVADERGGRGVKKAEKKILRLGGVRKRYKKAALADADRGGGSASGGIDSSSDDGSDIEMSDDVSDGELPVRSRAAPRTQSQSPSRSQKKLVGPMLRAPLLGARVGPCHGSSREYAFEIKLSKRSKAFSGVEVLKLACDGSDDMRIWKDCITGAAGRGEGGQVRHID